MDLIITVTLFCSVLKAAVGFNVDSDSWKILSHSDESFGYQVVQRQSDLLVSAPLLQYEHNKRGRIFQCSTNSCGNLPALEQRAAVNMSLGLAMAYDPSTQNTMVCGPTIPNDYASIAMYNGLCFEIDSNNTLVKSYPPAIEGPQGSGQILKQEMSQEGFRAAYVSGYIQMSVVGANQWRGGYKKYQLGADLNPVSFEPSSIEPDSYLGYSMAVAKTNDGPLTILGAPRNQHKGVVMIVFNEQLRDQIRPFQSQTGEYFGAEVCAMDVDSDDVTDLILISSPMYKDVDREGRVYVCDLSRLSVVCYFDNPSQITTLRGDASVRGRFGSSLAVLPDINADAFNDLAVGAPLENDGQGSIYIFQGEGGRKINPTYSQRIAASAVQSGLKSFGISISQSSYDQSGDGLPDLAVGSKGKVVLLRSRPVVTVTATVSFNPNLIPTQNPDCSKPLPSNATVCFTMSKLSNVNEAQAQVNFTLTLDANRKIPNNRAEISKDVRHKSGSLNLLLDKNICTNVYFFIESCPEDALNPLNNELRFTFDGLPSGSNPRPSLSPQVKTTTFHPLGFEIR